MKSQKLLSYTRRAINDYDMISPGDKIAIGISGGKDSLTLLYAMSKLKKFYPIPFEIEAITVDLGFKDFDTSRLKEYCESLGVNYTVCKTHIGEIVFDYRKEPNHSAAVCVKEPSMIVLQNLAATRSHMPITRMTL